MFQTTLKLERAPVVPSTYSASQLTTRAGTLVPRGLVYLVVRRIVELRRCARVVRVEAEGLSQGQLG